MVFPGCVRFLSSHSVTFFFFGFTIDSDYSLGIFHFHQSLAKTLGRPPCLIWDFHLRTILGFKYILLPFKRHNAAALLTCLMHH